MLFSVVIETVERSLQFFLLHFCRSKLVSFREIFSDLSMILVDQSVTKRETKQNNIKATKQNKKKSSSKNEIK